MGFPGTTRSEVFSNTIKITQVFAYDFSPTYPVPTLFPFQRFLVVDDNSIDTIIITRVLQKWNWLPRLTQLPMIMRRSPTFRLVSRAILPGGDSAGRGHARNERLCLPGAMLQGKAFRGHLRYNHYAHQFHSSS